MNILEIGIQRGIEQGHAEALVKSVESAMKNFSIDLQKACEGLGTTVEEYKTAKEQKKNQGFLFMVNEV